MADIARGRRHFFYVVGGFIGISLFGALVTHLRGAPTPPLSIVRGPGLMILLAVLAYVGVYWARGAITVWMWLTALGHVIGGIALLRRFPSLTLMSFAWAAAFAYGGWFLYNNPDVEAFILRRNTAPVPRRQVTLKETDP